MNQNNNNITTNIIHDLTSYQNNNNGMEGGFQGIGFSSDNNNSAVPGITNANATNTMESYFQQHQTTSTHLYNQQQQQIYQNVNIDVTKSIQAAQAIAMKFHSQNKQKAQIEAQTQQLINGIPLPPLPQTILPPPSLPPSSYTSGQQQKRPTSFDVQHYQQLFQNRLQKAFLKNLEYIAKKDEEALQQQLQQIEQSKQYDQYLSHHSNMSLQQRQQHLQSSSTKQQKQQQTQVLTTKAGVGTGIRKRQSKEERLKIYAHIEDQCTKNSVYVMGIQIDRHSTSSGHTMEQDIHNDLYSLFQAYGSIHKVKLYKHFKTGQLKGDALITYQEDVDITLVCSQLHGAELPCGSILNVQPATFDSKKDSNRESNHSHYQPNTTNHNGCDSKNQTSSTFTQPTTTSSTPSQPSPNNNDPISEGQDDDLDDFFDSLG